MRQLIQTFKDKTKDNWGIQNEYIIAASVFSFSLAVLIIYQGVVFSPHDNAINTNLTFFFITIFPIFCALRLICVYKGKTTEHFGALTGAIDILLLSAIIFMFSQQYNSAAATLKSPSFVFYFVLIALHAMRFKPNLILLNGTLSVIAWASIVISLTYGSSQITHTYIDYINSGALLIGAEIEKLFALTVFTLALALGAGRARVLHGQEKMAQKNLSRVRREEEERISRLKSEQRISRLKSEFLSTMSHELRTPMNGVLGMVQTLRLTDLNQSQSGMLDIMETSGDSLTRLLHNILEFSRLSDGAFDLTTTPFHLTDVVNDAVDPLMETINSKGLDFQLDIDANTPLSLSGDPMQLIQILELLLDNAVKFTHEGTIRVFIHGNQKNGHALLSLEVHDSGIGIDPAHLETIFKPFHQIDGSITREYGGTGMGLALCQRLVETMGGQIFSQSIPKIGSVFTVEVRLPLSEKTEPQHAELVS